MAVDSKEVDADCNNDNRDHDRHDDGYCVNHFANSVIIICIIIQNENIM